MADDSETAWPEDEQHIDAIGQNGNGGEHYEALASEADTKAYDGHD